MVEHKINMQKINYIFIFGSTGFWSPKSTCRSTPDFSIAARRINPPLEPSRSMAKQEHWQ
jgi:hypothetical protein